MPGPLEPRQELWLLPQLDWHDFQSAQTGNAHDDQILIKTTFNSRASVDAQLRYYEAEHPYLRAHQNNARVRLITEAIRPWLDERARILEVGAGYGRFTQALVSCGYDVTPSDVSPVMLERLAGKSRRAPVLIDLQDPTGKWPKAYDVIIGFHILHHLADLSAAFRVCYRHLRTGGRILFVEPNYRNLLYYVQLLVTPQLKWAAERGVLNIRQSLLRDQLMNAGFTNIRFDRFGYLPDLLLQRALGWKLEKLITRYNQVAFGSLYLCITATKA